MKKRPRKRNPQENDSIIQNYKVNTFIARVKGWPPDANLVKIKKIAKMTGMCKVTFSAGGIDIKEAFKVYFYYDDFDRAKKAIEKL